MRPFDHALAQIFAMSFIFCFAIPAHAGPKADYANCTLGKGCTCIVGHVDLHEYEVIMGSPAPNGAENMTLVFVDRNPFWSPVSFDDLDLIYGGDGICTPQLFDIIPEDGTWIGSVRVQKVEGCLPQVGEMVRPIVDAMSVTRKIAWGGKFHPSHFAGDAAPQQIRWTELNPTLFEGTIPVPQNGTLDVTVKTTATLTAPDKAEATLSLRMADTNGTNAAAMAMIGMADCRADAEYDFVRVGP